MRARGSLFLIFEGFGRRSENHRFSMGTLEGPRLREHGQVRLKGRSVGQYSFIQETPLSKQDTGYSIQDTGIEE